MFSRKYKLKLLVLVSAIALFSFLITLCAPPVLAQDRVFLDLSLDYLGEYQLPKMKFLGTPVGGLSAITYDRRRDRFYALSNDQSEFSPARFYTLKITLNSSETAKIGIQKVDVESVTFLTDKDGQTYPKGTISPKGIALTPQKTVFISGGIAQDQIAPFIQEFDINTGQMRDSLPIPERYLPDVADEPERTRGVTQTSAFASLTFNPTGTIPASGEPIRLFTATESALVQDQDLPGSEQKTKCRFLHYLIGYGGPVLISEYFYPLELTPDGAISNDLEELIAVDQGGHFLSLERSTGQSGFSEKIFQMATGGATDTSRIASLKGSLNGIRPIQKKLLLDLNELGIPLDNLQGMTLGPRLSDGTQSLVLVSDDNFDDKQVTKLLLFRLSKPKTKVTAPLRRSLDQ